ncbi:MAG TPA: peroxidase-related enzyme [Chloroflexota bacterium]|nr:peroxidase-related enzyme [Chloroflexota bacterium]
MTFLQTVPDDEATGEVAKIYRQEIDASGYVPESTRALTTRPDVLAAYTSFVGAIRGGFTLPARDWRLITLVAAKHIPSTYCSLAYGKGLLGDLGSPEAVLAVQRDFRQAGLSPRDVAMLEYAEKVTVAASKIEQADVDRLREHGFSDAQISDIALCAAWRNFISRFFDAVGAMPDDEYRALDPSFRDPLCVGRPFR